MTSIDLCAGFVKIGETTSGSLTAQVRHLRAGEWILSAPLAGLDVGSSSVEQIDSIIVYDDDMPGRILLGGTVRTTASITASRLREVNPQGTMVTFSGVDEFGLLGIRTAWPTPTMNPPWTGSHDTRTGPASSVAAGYITANFGSGALADRQISGVSIIDPAVGESGTWSARLQPLDQWVGRICREAGLFCRATMTSAGLFEYRFGSPSDHSSSLILTDQGDLESLSRLVTPASASHVIGAGRGELTARAFASSSSGATGINRVESIYENTQIVLQASLVRATRTQLTEGAEDVSIDGVISDAATQRFKWLDDYDVGDWLGVEVDGVRYSAQVEGVMISLDEKRRRIAPVLGRATANGQVKLIRDIADINSNLSAQIS